MTNPFKRPRAVIPAGTRFGLLVVEGRAPDHMRSCNYKKERRIRSAWWCLCDCGERVSVSMDGLKSGLTRSCGCLRRQAVHRINARRTVPVGERFGALVVEGAAPSEATGGARWSCRCDCGRVVVVRAVNVRRRADRPCGCAWRKP